jgi:hypothetical protein
MARKAALFEEAGGSPLRAYLLLKQGDSSANIPPMWIERAKKSRKDREEVVAQAMKRGRPKDIVKLEDWELTFRKEQFYLGLRILLELERHGKTKL